MLRSIIAACLGICLAGAVYAQKTQDISGSWYGFFRTPQGQKQRLQLVFQKEGAGYSGQMKSPDVTDDAISMDNVTLNGDTLRFSIKRIHLDYKGIWSVRYGRFNGYFAQAGNQAELDLSRKEISEDDLPTGRPQDPTPPFAYDIEDVKFVNATDKVLLAGTFTKPPGNGPFPVVILVSGSGAHDRDGEMVGHRPFAVIADYFAKHGIASLRFDDRGVGGSTGNYDSSDIYNFAGDVRAAIDFAARRPEVDTGAIGLLGHSEGGIAAQIAAAGNNRLAFVISMASPGVDGLAAYNSQLAHTAAAYGENGAYVKEYLSYYKPYLELLMTEKDTTARRTKGYDYLSAVYRHFGDSANRAGEQYFIEQAYREDTRPEMLSMLRYDPAPYLAKIKCPVLAINGTKDVQVDADLNLKGIEDGLRKGGNEQVTVRRFFGLNHLFQRCNTCTREEYGTLDETINPSVLEFITRWIGMLPGNWK